ncbi:hypothetical protein [Microbispora triticiradicis]|uniref:hypothetical protein n=1 Tax=Microbispora triticiradicis TaxID=2200763 RepID=UPI001AD74879|nr:hypothetical protein [Microbispora triticiradicis]MBO4272366.1 hypothetical protein [Microbispora triticiradicis]
MGLRDRWTVLVNGHPAKTTTTRRGADGWTNAARDAGQDARTERTRKCPTCQLHGCAGGLDCPDA